MKVQITTSSFDLNNFVESELLASANIEIALNPMKNRLTESQVTELLNEDPNGLSTQKALEAVLKNK